MRHWLRLVFILFVLILLGCEEDLEIGLKPDVPVRISYDGTKYTEILIEPSTKGYRQLATWVNANKLGWARFLATPPVTKGVWVSNGEISLHFFSSFVIAYTHRGLFTKAFDPSKYSFFDATMAPNLSFEPAASDKSESAAQRRR